MSTTQISNVRTATGNEVHRGKLVSFILHPMFGKIQGNPKILIPGCSGIRVRASLSVDGIYTTDEAVTCQKCKGK